MLASLPVVRFQAFGMRDESLRPDAGASIAPDRSIHH
jgi:hypothetical protein